MNREKLARKEYREKRVAEVIEANKVPWDLMVHRARQAKWVALVHRVLKETSEDQEIRDRLDL